MRVALYLPNLGGGGAERVALACANDLIEHGHEVDLVLADGGGDLLPLLSPKVRVVELRAHRTIAALVPLARYLRERRPDALHAHIWPGTIVAIMAHKLAGSNARLIVSDHVAYSQPFLSAKQVKLLRWTTKLLYPLADHRVQVSVRAADDLAAISGIPRDQFDVVYNPITVPRRIAVSPQIEALWGGATKRIINVGSMKEQKNQALLIRAFAVLDDPKSALMILGDGALRSELEALSKELGVAERVIMPGFKVNQWPYLASAHLFVLSSNYEGFPLVIPEAMFVGLNIVSTDCVSGPEEMLDRGRFGILVPCNDHEALAEAMRTALTKPHRPERMHKRAEELCGKSALARHRQLLSN